MDTILLVSIIMIATLTGACVGGMAMLTRKTV